MRAANQPLWPRTTQATHGPLPELAGCSDEADGPAAEKPRPRCAQGSHARPTRAPLCPRVHSPALRADTVQRARESRPLLRCSDAPGAMAGLLRRLLLQS